MNIQRHLICSKPNAEELVKSIGMLLVTAGHEVEVKGNRLKEIIDFKSILENPQQRWVLDPSKKANVFAQCAETVWILSGRNDVEWLKMFLPRAPDFSDDGIIWRAGYGERLMNWKEMGLNQLQNLLDHLKKDLNSRQAVASLWDPEREGRALELGSKDFPCNHSLQFLQRGGKLYMRVTNRSNDLWWGFSGVNLVEFTVIQELMAMLLGLELGDYTADSYSMHIYERHWEIVNKFRNEAPIPYESWSGYDYSDVPYQSWDHLQEICKFHTECLERGTLGLNGIEVEETQKLGVLGDLLLASDAYREPNPKESPLVQAVQDPNLRKALQNSWIPKDHFKAFVR